MDGHEQDLDHRIKYLDAGLDSNGPTDHEGSGSATVTDSPQMQNGAH